MELAARTTSGWTPASVPSEIAPGAARSLLFFGPDEGGLFEYARLAAGSGDRERMDARTFDPNEAISALGAGSLFGGATTVILDNVSETHRAKIETILAAPFADGARLIVMAGDLKGGSKLRKLYKDTPDLVGVPLYAMRPGEISAFAKKFFAGEKLDMTRDAGPALVDRLSGDRAQAARACEIVALHARGCGRGEVTLSDVRAVLDTVDEEALSAPIDQALQGNAGAALAALQVRMSSGEAAIKMLRIFAARLQRFQDILATGLPPKDAVSKAKPPVFWAEKDLVTRIVGGLSPDRISRLLQIIDRTEYTIIERGTPDLPAMSALVIEISNHKKWKAA